MWTMQGNMEYLRIERGHVCNAIGYLTGALGEAEQHPRLSVARPWLPSQHNVTPVPSVHCPNLPQLCKLSGSLQWSCFPAQLKSFLLLAIPDPN